MNSRTPSSENLKSVIGAPIVRRTLIGGSIALAGGALLAACSGSGSGSSSGGSRTINMWTWYQEQAKQWPQLASAYEKAHPGVTVKIRTFGSTTDYSPALTAAISAGQTPDIFAPSFGAVSYGQQGVAADLKTALGTSFLSNFFDSENAQFSSGGKQYGLGWMAQTFGLFYDPSVLQKVNVTVPETWDDLIKAVPSFRKAGLTPLSIPGSPSYGFADFVLPLVTQASNDPTLLLQIDAQQNGKTWNDPAVVAALDKFASLVKAGVFDKGVLAATFPIAQNQVTSGKSGFFLTGSWAPQGFTTAAPNWKYEIAKAPAWAPGAKHWTSDQAGAALSLSASSKNQADAVNFLKFIFDPARYSKTMNDSLSMPATKAAAATISSPQMKTMTSWMLEGDGAPHIMYGAGSETGVSDACVAIVQGKTNAKEAAASIQKAVDVARKK